MAEHNDLGKWGEEQAITYLKEKGYIIRHHDWCPEHSTKDIDIIAISPDATTVVFVEVKTRSSDELSSPEESVNRTKIRNIASSANTYIHIFDVVEDVRFDIISIIAEGRTVKRIDHIEDAFNPLLL